MQIGLIPLDERPVNTRYPQSVAQIAGAQVHLPPAFLLSRFHQPANLPRLLDWMDETAPDLDALVISFEMLAYGGLIASRTHHDSTGQVLARLQRLSTLSEAYPGLPLIGFNLIARVSNANSAVEEPAYWALEGERFYRFSQLLDQAEQGLDTDTELAVLQAALPHAHIQDFLQRRLRNHTTNLAALDMLSRQVLNLLVLSSDDTSPYGLPSSDKRQLSTWAQRLSLGERLMMYPGADEVGTALTARLINQQAGRRPVFEVYYAVPGGEMITAPYEDGPVSLTVERQIMAVGGRISLSESRGADFFLAVNPPHTRRSEWNPADARQERLERMPYLLALAEQINQRMEAGQAVIVADVAYPNGADPALIEVLFERVEIARLAAYGAWNTASNTIGVALGQGCAATLASSTDQQAAQQRFLLHRFLEDWGYQQVVRAETRSWLQAEFGCNDIQPDNEQEAIDYLFDRLQHVRQQIPGFPDLDIKPGSLHLPWKRLFEVDFEITNQCV